MHSDDGSDHEDAVKKRKANGLESMNARASKVQSMNMDSVIEAAMRHIDSASVPVSAEGDCEDDDDIFAQNTSVNEAMSILAGSVPKAAPKPVKTILAL